MIVASSAAASSRLECAVNAIGLKRPQLVRMTSSVLRPMLPVAPSTATFITQLAVGPFKRHGAQFLCSLRIDSNKSDAPPKFTIRARAKLEDKTINDVK